MRQLLLFGTLTILLGTGISHGASKDIRFFDPENLLTTISGHDVDYDFILLDIRDDWELAKGVIASRYCRPYHLSWAAGELQEQYRLLPDTVCILIYSQTGAPQTIDAANFLAANGYPCLGCLNGGVRMYETVGELRDSAEIKPLSLLPQPSYFGDTTGVMSAKPRFHVEPRSDARRYCFTLQGRALQTVSGENHAPMYLLARQGGTILPMIKTSSRSALRHR